MGQFMWITFTTAVGALIGAFVPDVPHPWIGGLIGLAIGLITLMGDDLSTFLFFDAIGDIFDH